jgi:hypothetical protein
MFRSRVRSGARCLGEPPVRARPEVRNAVHLAQREPARARVARAGRRGRTAGLTMTTSTPESVSSARPGRRAGAASDVDGGTTVSAGRGANGASDGGTGAPSSADRGKKDASDGCHAARSASIIDLRAEPDAEVGAESDAEVWEESDAGGCACLCVKVSAAASFVEIRSRFGCRGVDRSEVSMAIADPHDLDSRISGFLFRRSARGGSRLRWFALHQRLRGRCVCGLGGRPVFAIAGACRPRYRAPALTRVGRPFAG